MNSPETLIKTSLYRYKVLVYYLYTPANRSDVLALAHIHFMYLVSVNSLHPSSINHTDAYTSSGYECPDTSNNMNLIV